MNLRWNCQAQGCYKQECLPDWSIYNECWPRGIRPTDIDGAVEIDGRLLFLERKKSRSITRGQRIMFDRLASMPDVTVIVEADVADDGLRDWLILDGKRAAEWQTITLAQAQAWLKWWAAGSR